VPLSKNNSPPVRQISFVTNFISRLPDHRPQKLSLGTVETKILNIIWDVGAAIARDIHQKILVTPDRELANASVMTVLNRLAKKGWICSEKKEKILHWRSLISQFEFQTLLVYLVFQYRKSISIKNDLSQNVKRQLVKFPTPFFNAQATACFWSYSKRCLNSNLQRAA
jgi:predicted transcriptional regulator